MERRAFSEVPLRPRAEIPLNRRLRVSPPDSRFLLHIAPGRAQDQESRLFISICLALRVCIPHLPISID